MVTGLPCVCNIDNLTTIKQSTYYHCAAACIKMCTQTERSQEDIFQELHAATNEKDLWYAEPDSVFTYLGKYESIERTSEDCKDSRDATEKIISSFATSKKSAPMLVLGGKHWVLYSGYQMNEKGELKGIYIRDPWPTAAPLTFYPFSDYFFDEYFCAIDVRGKLRGCVESFITSGTRKIFGIDVIKKPRHGGSNIFNDIFYFKKDIIREDLQNYGFTNALLNLNLS